jgi:hypothetical protein
MATTGRAEYFGAFRSIFETAKGHEWAKISGYCPFSLYLFAAPFILKIGVRTAGKCNNVFVEVN